jgi:hypothetical protein
MCWNAEVSLNTFIFGIVSAIIVLILNKLKYHLVLILLSFTSIQLLEYFTWKNLNNKKVIRILSIIGIQIIFIQLLLLNYYLPRTQKLKIILTSAVVITYILFLLFQFPYVKLDMEKSKINKHLIWHWLDLPLFWLLHQPKRKMRQNYINNYVSFFSISVNDCL